MENLKPVVAKDASEVSNPGWTSENPEAPQDEPTRRVTQFLFAAAVEAFDYGNKHGDMSAYEALVQMLDKFSPVQQTPFGVFHPEANLEPPSWWATTVQYEAWGREGQGEDPRDWWALYAHRPDETEGGMQEVYHQ